MMTVISHQNADRYLQETAWDQFIFLIFGSDQGLIYERRRKLVRAAIGPNGDPLQAVELSGDAIADDPLILVDEANAINMLGGPVRLIQISSGNKSILPALELLAQSPPADCVIVIEEGDLKRESPLRKWIEKQSCGAAIECRADDPKDLQRLIDAELHNANLSIDPDAREVLGAMLGEDRLSTRSELEKLILYARGQNAITIDHINDILHDASALGVDAALSAIFSGRTGQSVELVNKALRLGVELNTLVAAALRYALALHRCRSDIDNGASFDDGLQALLRQIRGYNRKAEISIQLKSIRLKTIEIIIYTLSRAIKTSRQDNTLTEERLLRLFVSLTSLIRRS